MSFVPAGSLYGALESSAVENFSYDINLSAVNGPSEDILLPIRNILGGE